MSTAYTDLSQTTSHFSNFCLFLLSFTFIFFSPCVYVCVFLQFAANTSEINYVLFITLTLLILLALTCGKKQLQTS